MWQKLNKSITTHKKLWAFLLGSITVQALPPFYHISVLFVCLSLLLWILDQCKNKKKAFAVGYWFGFGFFAFGLSWVNNALLVHPEKTGWLIPIAFLASGAFFGLFTALPALLSWLVKPIFARWLAFSGWMVLFEWIRSWLLTGFPWNLWGSCLAFNLELLQTASIIGTYGLSLLVLLITSAPIFWLIKPTLKRALVFIFIFLASFILFAFGHWRIASLSHDTESKTFIRLVQPSIPQTVKWNQKLQQEHFQKYLQLSSKKSEDNISIIIWGETASPYPLDRDDKARDILAQALPTNAHLITGTIRYETDYYGGWLPLNSALIINQKGVIEDFYDKSHLVPFGEYIPLRKYLPDILQPVANTIGTFKAGKGPKVISLPNAPSFGIQICYEIIFPHQIIDPKNKPDWLINLTNDGWYGISAGPHQHLVSTQLRAIEEGLTIARSANSGISALINRYGKILGSLALQEEGVLDIALPKQTKINTLYNKTGNYLPLLCCLFCIILSFFINRKK